MDAETAGKLNDLKNRRELVKVAIGVLKNSADDPRQPKSLEKYAEQLRIIEEKIAQIEAVQPAKVEQPQTGDIVIGLKTATIFPKAKL